MIFLLKSIYGLTERVHSKAKQYFDYQDWYDKGIHTVADLKNVPDPDNVLFTL